MKFATIFVHPASLPKPAADARSFPLAFHKHLGPESLVQIPKTAPADTPISPHLHQ